MNPAKVSREAKDRQPENWCPAKDCLWRTGGGFCPRHKSTAVTPATAHISVSEITVPPFNDGGEHRRWFHARFDRPFKRVSLVSGGLLKNGKIFCGDHGIDDECVCKAAVREYMETHNAPE